MTSAPMRGKKVTTVKVERRSLMEDASGHRKIT
jgi:ribosomal protein L21